MLRQDQIERMLVETLAQAMRRDPTDLARELRHAGPEMPCGSQRLVRAAVKVARQLGIQLKPNRAIAPYFRSVSGVAQLLTALAKSAGRTAA